MPGGCAGRATGVSPRRAHRYGAHRGTWRHRRQPHRPHLRKQESGAPLERTRRRPALKFLLWLILLVLCWPLALLAVVLYPVVWVLLLPFRLVGIAVDGVLGVLRAIVTLPGRLLGATR